MDEDTSGSRWGDPGRDLDDAVRAAASVMLNPGELVVHWVLVAAVRNPADGGDVVVIPSDDALPGWAVKGVLVDALDEVRAGAGRAGGGGAVPGESAA